MIKCQLKHSFLLPLLELDPINNVFYLQSAEHVPTDNAFTLSPTYWCQYWYWYWCQTQNGRNRISQVSPGHQCMSNDRLYVCYKIYAKYTWKYWKEFDGDLVKIVWLAEKSCPVAFFCQSCYSCCCCPWVDTLTGEWADYFETRRPAGVRIPIIPLSPRPPHLPLPGILWVALQANGGRGLHVGPRVVLAGRN